MEQTITQFGQTLTAFCNHIQTSCDALKLSLDRRPIPLDSASSTFIQCLNRGVSAASTDLNLLESMSIGTVSFEELLGHCNELYKKNQDDLLQLQDQLVKSSSYSPEIYDYDDEEVEEYDEPTFAAAGTVIRSFEDDDDPLMDDSLRLKNLGLSDVCLAALASEANSKIDDPDISMRESMNHYGDKDYNIRSPRQISGNILGVNEGGKVDVLKSAEDARSFIELSKNDYDGLPSYMKTLTSWEDMVAAVDKINSSLREKENMKECNFFHQDEIASLGLGPKVRTYLLLLMRMNQMAVETIDGSISYKILPRR
ncbi:uncharacterized protein LOC126676521 [Mercurialis annua]|uniref:uncharacterized protein LOC126676521 n=1 Tax=Mercurialis annua TaxID=3986 RepID=UPI00215E5C57|nr:uncharacterized protein LOC126676521 [Mercurialis annua]